MKKIAVILLFIVTQYSYAIEQETYTKSKKRVSFAPQYTEITFYKIYNEQNKATYFQTPEELENAKHSANIDSLLEDADEKNIPNQPQVTK